jgi:hypothetical protein
MLEDIDAMYSLQGVNVLDPNGRDILKVAVLLLTDTLSIFGSSQMILLQLLANTERLPVSTLFLSIFSLNITVIWDKSVGTLLSPSLGFVLFTVGEVKSTLDELLSLEELLPSLEEPLSRNPSLVLLSKKVSADY